MISRLSSLGVLLLVLTIGTGWAATRYVDPSGASGVCNDSTCLPCCTIQAAVTKSSGGDVISVADGTYAENVDFSAMLSAGSITLETTSVPGNVTVSPSSDDAIRYGSGLPGTVTIEGINVESATGKSCVFLNHAGDAVLRNVTANACGETAIDLENTGSATLEQVTANGSQKHGIQVSDANGVMLTDCTTNSNASSGIQILTPAGAVEISDSTANNNIDHGIDMDLRVPLTISGTMVGDNGRRGVWAQTDSTVAISSSTITGNQWDGVLLEQPGSGGSIDQITLATNMFTDNLDSGVSLSDLDVAGTFDATCNDFMGNGDHGLHLDSLGTVDATFAWWGDPTGPSGQGPGSGDSVFAEGGGTILYAPWLAESCTGCSGVVNLVLEHDSVNSTESYKACYSITAGPNYGVYGPSGDLTLTAPQIVLRDGFFVGVDGSLTAVN